MIGGGRAEPRSEELASRSSESAFRDAIPWGESSLGHARELVSYRELLYMVTLREIKVRYKQTAFGALWAVLQPVSLMIVFTVFVSLFAGLGSGDIPYPLFSYAALLPWTFFSTSLAFAVPSLIANSHIITRIYFPREIVPLASVLAALVDFGIASLVFGAMLVFFRVTPTWNVVYLVPLLIVQIAFTTAVCLFLSATTVHFRDVRFTVPLLVQVWMFVTPILYPVSVIPDGIRDLYMIVNPMAVVVDGLRRAVVQGQSPHLPYLIGAMIVALGLLWLAYRYFKRLERVFADIV